VPRKSSRRIAEVPIAVYRGTEPEPVSLEETSGLGSNRTSQ
jgi:hypothetical protein